LQARQRGWFVRRCAAGSESVATIQALGLPAVLPPPEEEKNVESAIGAARAKNAREDML